MLLIIVSLSNDKSCSHCDDWPRSHRHPHGRYCRHIPGRRHSRRGHPALDDSRLILADDDIRCIHLSFIYLIRVKYRI